MPRLIPLATLLVAVAFAGPVQAQPDRSEHVDRALDRLELSAPTADAVRSALADVEPVPGALWDAAATLAERLTPEQQTELIAAAKGHAEQQRARRTRPGTRSAERRAPERMTREGARHAAPGAHLSEEQRAAIADLRARYAPRFRELAEARQTGTLTPEAHREAVQALTAQIRQEAEQHMTPEQRERVRSWSPRATAEQSQAARAAALDLTPEQEARMEDLRAERRTRLQQQREAAAPRQRRGDAQRYRGKAAEAQVTILTPEQQRVVELHRALAGTLGPHAVMMRQRMSRN